MHRSSKQYMIVIGTFNLVKLLTQPKIYGSVLLFHIPRFSSPVLAMNKDIDAVVKTRDDDYNITKRQKQLRYQIKSTIKIDKFLIKQHSKAFDSSKNDTVSETSQENVENSIDSAAESTNSSSVSQRQHTADSDTQESKSPSGIINKLPAQESVNSLDTQDHLDTESLLKEEEQVRPVVYSEINFESLLNSQDHRDAELLVLEEESESAAAIQPPGHYHHFLTSQDHRDAELLVLQGEWVHSSSNNFP